MAGGSCPPLPREILSLVVSHLDPTDRQTLRALCLVSQECWDVAARVLYRRLSLHPRRFRQLLSGGRIESAVPPPTSQDVPSGRPYQTHAFNGVLTDRARRAFAFVERLQIIGGLDVTTVHMMWDTARESPDPLFPRVREVLLEDGPSPHIFYFSGTFGARPPNPQTPVFAAVDICAIGDSSIIQWPATRPR